LNAPEPSTDNANGVDGDNQVESPEDSHAQGMPAAYMTPEAALHYQQYLQQQPQSNQYPGMPQGSMPRHPAQHYPQDQKL
jgi:pheromone receptor transcription factor